MINPLPIKKIQVDYLPVSIYADNLAMGQAAAFDARENILKAISERGEASIILATGNSQLTFLHALKELDGIDWNKVRIFHMDEYLGLPPTHQASCPATPARSTPCASAQAASGSPQVEVTIP